MLPILAVAGLTPDVVEDCMIKQLHAAYAGASWKVATLTCNMWFPSTGHGCSRIDIQGQNLEESDG